jgi:hypothetical protein
VLVMEARDRQPRQRARLPPRARPVMEAHYRADRHGRGRARQSPPPRAGEGVVRPLRPRHRRVPSLHRVPLAQGRRLVELPGETSPRGGRAPARSIAGSKPVAPIGRFAFVHQLGGCQCPWCPIAALHERFERLALAVAAAHRVGVHAQRELRVGVPICAMT